MTNNANEKLAAALERVNSYIAAYEDAPYWGGPTIWPSAPKVDDLKLLCEALTSQPHTSDVPVAWLRKLHEAMADMMEMRRLATTSWERDKRDNAIAVWREVEAFLAAPEQRLGQEGEKVGLEIAERIRQEMTSGRQWWLDALTADQRQEFETELASTCVAICEAALSSIPKGEKE